MYGYIYKTTNTVNGKIYIGQHKKEHFDPFYYGSGPELKKALKIYNKNVFTIEILQKAESQEELDELEIFYIDQYMNEYGQENMYNTSVQCIGGSIEYRKNWSDDKKEAFREKMTKINRERCATEEFRKRRSYECIKYFREHPEKREEVGNRFREYWKDPETKKMRSEKLKKTYAEHPELREHLSDMKKKRIVLEIDNKPIVFFGIKEMRKYLKEKYNYTPDFRMLKRLTDEGKDGPGRKFFHDKFKHLDGLKIYFDDDLGVETRGDECSPVGNEIGTFPKRETPVKKGNRKFNVECPIEFISSDEDPNRIF